MGDIPTWLSTLIAFLSLGVSIFTLAQSRNSLSLYLGCDIEGTVLYVTNNSPHAVTLSDFGVIRADGRRQSLTGENWMARRVEPRHLESLVLAGDIESDLRRINKVGGKYAVYVSLATLHRFYSVGTVRRWWWWLSGWLNGSRSRFDN